MWKFQNITDAYQSPHVQILSWIDVGVFSPPPYVQSSMFQIRMTTDKKHQLNVVQPAARSSSQISDSLTVNLTPQTHVWHGRHEDSVIGAKLIFVDAHDVQVNVRLEEMDVLEETGEDARMATVETSGHFSRVAAIIVDSYYVISAVLEHFDVEGDDDGLWQC